MCVTPDEFSFWEFRDKAFAELAGFHGFLPKVNLVQKLVIRHLKDDFKADNLRARPAPGVTNPQWPGWLKVKS